MADDLGGSLYQDFVVKIDRDGDGYRVSAQSSAGEAENAIHFPFDEKDLKIFLLEAGQSRKVTSRGHVPEPMQKTKDFGSKLYESIISGSVRDVLVATRHDAEQGGYGVRLQLRLTGAPELASLPWEFLFDGRDFLALTGTTPVVRYLDLKNAPRPMAVALPLRILVTISSPQNLEQLDVAAERQRVEDALSSLREHQTVEIEYMEDATLASLQRTLRQARSQDKPFHIWHYIGHGGIDPTAQASVLMFTDESGMGSPVDGFQLGTMFGSYPDTRLVLLNACEGARSEGDDPFAGVATALVERGVPAVIGMQFEISDRAAITFAGEFYSAVVDGLPVDAALSEARRAVFFLPNWTEWATPVLFMRVKDGRLFDVQAAPPPQISEDGTALDLKPIPQIVVIPTITALEGPIAGQTIEISEDVLTLGRSSDNNVPLDDSKVSRHHAQIEKQGKEWIISDLGSTNGTKVSEVAITGPYVLQDGDKFQIGHSIFQVAIEGATIHEVVAPVPRATAPSSGQPALAGAMQMMQGMANILRDGIPASQAAGAQRQPSAPAETPGRTYEVPSFDAMQLAERLQQWFFNQQYTAQILKNDNMFAVQGRKEDMMRNLLGMSYAATVIIEPQANGFKASVGGGKWIDKAAVAAVGMFVAFGFTVFTAGYGATQQKQLESNLWLLIDQFANSSGGRRTS